MAMTVIAAAFAPAMAKDPPADFSGATLGLEVDYGFGGNSQWCFCTNVPIAVDATGGDGGVVGGLQAGYDVRVDRFVVGAETRLSFSDLAFANECSDDVHCSGVLRWAGEVHARAGVVFDDILIYAMGGYAFGTVHSQTIDLSGAAPIAISADELHEGPVAGGGVELAMGEGWRFGLQYTFYDMSGSGGVLGGRNIDLDWTAHAGGLRIAYEIPG